MCATKLLSLMVPIKRCVMMCLYFVILSIYILPTSQLHPEDETDAATG